MLAKTHRAVREQGRFAASRLLCSTREMAIFGRIFADVKRKGYICE